MRSQQPKIIGRKNFTLIEILVVITIALLLMAIGAGLYGKIARQLRLSTASGTVAGVLNDARAQALRTNQVITVYFLDGGVYNNTFAPNTNGAAYYAQPEKFSKPYALYVVDQKGLKIRYDMLPPGIGWLDTNCIPRQWNSSDTTTTEYPYNLDNDGELNNRLCSLAIKFSPKGSAWAVTIDNQYKLWIPYDAQKVAGILGTTDSVYESGDADPNNGKNGTDHRVRSKKSCELIRIFPFDRMIKSDGDFVKFENPQWHNRRSEDISADADPWRTVKINYTTGVVSVISGSKETAADSDKY